jgi:glycosyltransferase involved in cell wall biosynthesis
MLATILIAVYNEQKHIQQCVSSLLQQGHAPVEIIVIDDGSTDRTVELVRSFPSVRLLQQPHLGKAKAVNWGAKEATGDVLVFLDGDMYFDKDYLTRLLEPIVSGRAVGSCHVDEFVANASNTWATCLQLKSGLPVDRRVRLSASDWEQGSVVFRAVRKDRFLEVGGFDDIGFFDDQTLYRKLGQRAAFVDGAVCYHYNPETLHEVFRSGVWGGKSMALEGGWRSLLLYLPCFAPVRAARSAARLRTPSVFLYDLVREWGIFFGLFKILTRLESTYGK